MCRIKCPQFSNTFTLLIVLAMNIGITFAQGFAAIYANSLALLMDDVQMGIDTLTCESPRLLSLF